MIPAYLQSDALADAAALIEEAASVYRSARAITVAPGIVQAALMELGLLNGVAGAEMLDAVRVAAAG